MPAAALNPPTIISHLGAADRRALLDDLNYLNMGEIKSFCKKHSIPYSIWIETKEGVRKTPAEDRKGIVLDRVRHYLMTGKVAKPTRFPANVVRFEKLAPTLEATNRLYYGQYDKKNRTLMALLEKLTDSEFKDGAIARILMNEFWRKGVAPTYREYAATWLKAKENHKRPNPEWAFLSDRAARKDTRDWTALRTKKAKHVVRILAGITPPTTLRPRRTTSARASTRK